MVLTAGILLGCFVLLTLWVVHRVRSILWPVRLLDNAAELYPMDRPLQTTRVWRDQYIGQAGRKGFFPCKVKVSDIGVVVIDKYPFGFARMMIPWACLYGPREVSVPSWAVLCSFFCLPKRLIRLTIRGTEIELILRVGVWRRICARVVSAEHDSVSYDATNCTIRTGCESL
jgi:hypothetical protein